MSTLLADLIRKRTADSLLGVFSRTVDKIVEEMAHDLLRDAEFRADLEQLVRAALQDALKELNEPAPSEPSRSKKTNADLDQMIVEQRQMIADLRAKTPKSEPPP